MAALILSFAGGALGGAVGGGVGMVAGRLLGAVVGSSLDRALFGPRQPDGPRLKDLDVTASTEGAPIPRVYGRMRVAGQILWATRLEERAEGGGKGLFGGGSGGTSYTYFANLAVGLCEGPIARVGRIWADGKELDQRDLVIRVHRGTATQDADPLILAKEAQGAPAYRDLAYVVLERLPLEPFGNRIPQLTFEVVRPVGALESMIRAMVLIPGATEFGYEPAILTRTTGYGRAAPETRHTTLGGSDFSVSLDELQALCPNLERVALVVAWFGDDLRAGDCLIRPGVEARDRAVAGATWSVAGLDRSAAYLVSTSGGGPAYGGTPSDLTVIAAIRDLKARGLKVTLLPFLMMDVPAGNALPNPHAPATPGQPAYPWRGQIACHPAPGKPGSPDGTATAASQIAAFLGAAAPGDFAVSGDDVIYSGPPDWRYRRFILHAAHLAKAAGGVDAVAIGSEMVGLTRVRGAGGAYPFVAGLTALAGEVKAILPAATLTYAADWTEYGAHVLGADLRFPLDPLWAHPAIGAVGIDYYAPVADRRPGDPGSPYDPVALRAGLRAGEAFDYFYASEADRATNLRTPIADGLGKPWIHRQKDLAGWWSNSHVERVGGVETAATAWVPGMKPIWLTELGCPAVDKGANRPSVFPDPKSSVAGLPPFSTGARDDLIQRRMLEAALRALDPAHGATFAENPVSGVYAGRMVDPTAVHLWAWDARPWPAFPRAGDVWSDGGNWETGHWLTGRLGAAPLADVAAAILAEQGVDPVDATALEGVVDGVLIDRPMSARDALEPLSRAFGFELVEAGARLVARPQAGAVAAALDADDLVLADQGPLLALTRGQESELPGELTLAFAETDADFRASAVAARRLSGASRRVSALSLAVAADGGAMQARAEAALHALWAARDRAAFRLPPSRLALEPGDLVALTDAGRTRLLRLSSLEGVREREVEAEGAAPPVAPVLPTPTRRAYAAPPADAAPALLIVETPPLTDAVPPVLAYAAVAADPWRGPMRVWRSLGDGHVEAADLAGPTIVGETLTSLAPGPLWVRDRLTRLDVRLVAGALESLPETRVMQGANALALRTPAGAWEILQFEVATLVGPRTYRLSTLIRGVRATEAAMAPTPAGAPVVLLDDRLGPLGSDPGLLGQPWTWRAGPARAGPTGEGTSAVAAALGVTALRPLAPVQATARREGPSLRLSWRRRSRLGGSSLTQSPPLGEDIERYRIEIRAPGGQVLRAVETGETTWFYPDADLLADRAVAPAAGAHLAQLSAAIGPGAFAAISLPA